MRERRGAWTPWGRPSAPIATSDIRRWAIAVYWPRTPPRLYWDEDYAASTRWGGIVAPVEFNPFAWSIEPGPSRRELDGHTEHQSRRVNGGSRIRFGAAMRPGDRIEARSMLVEWRAKRGASGDLLFVDFRHQWRNQEGVTVRDAVHTLVYH
jgi:hypothetical protein